MDADRKLSISNSLQSYRDIVTARNVALLRIVIKCLEEQPNPTWCGNNLRKADETRMRVIGQYCLGDWHPARGPSAPGELLSEERYDDTVYMLDGFMEVSSSTREQEVSSWFTEVNREVAHLDHAFKHDKQCQPPDLPEDLKYLCTLCDAILGPGLPQWCKSQQIEFVSYGLLTRTPRTLLLTRADNSLSDDPMAGNDSASPLIFVWTGWDIAIALQTGEAPFPGGAFVLYCKLSMIDGRLVRPWQWRYGLCDGDWESELFDTVEEFLGYYAQFRETTEDEAREMAIPIEYMT